MRDAPQGGELRIGKELREDGGSFEGVEGVLEVRGEGDGGKWV